MVNTFVQPPAHKIYQRSSMVGGQWGKGLGVVPLVLSLAQIPEMLEYRVRDAADSNRIFQNWRPIYFSTTTGFQTITLEISAGFYEYIIEIRQYGFRNNIIGTTTPIAMGDVIVVASQSNAEDMFCPVASGDTRTISDFGLTISPWGRVFAAYATNSGALPAVRDFSEVGYPPTEWQLPSDGGNFNSTFLVEFTNRVVATTGVPLGIVGYAAGGTSMDSWLPGYTGTGTPHYSRLRRVIKTAGGRFSAFLFFQGHYEARNDNTFVNYVAQQKLLYTSLQCDFPHAVGYKKLIATIGGVRAYGNSPASVNMVRAAAQAYVASDPDAFYLDCLDCTQAADLVHPGQSGSILLARQFYRAFMHASGLTELTGRGPTVLHAARTHGTNVFRLTCSNPNRATAWQEEGDARDQFTIRFRQGSREAVPIRALDLTRFPEILLHAATEIADPAEHDILVRWSPDTAATISHGLYDNAIDNDGLSRGRQLGATGEAIRVDISGVGLAIDTIPTVTSGAAISVSGTYSKGPPTALCWALGDRLPRTDAIHPSIMPSSEQNGLFAFTIPLPALPAGLYRLHIWDEPSISYGWSNVFAVVELQHVPRPTFIEPIFGFSASAGQGYFFAGTDNTRQAVIGDPVQMVRDLSGCRNDFEQCDIGKAPRWEHSTVNGKVGLRFSSADRQILYLSAHGTLGSTLKTSEGYTMMAVFSLASVPDVASTIFCASERSANGGLNLIRGAQVRPTAVLASRNDDRSVYQPVVTAVVKENTLHRKITRYDRSIDLLTIKVNEFREGISKTLGLGVNAFDSVTIGGERTNGRTHLYFDGWLHEFWVWNTAISDIECEQLAAYMSAEWDSVTPTRMS